MEELYSQLLTTFNSIYDAVGSLCSKEVDAPEEIDYLVGSLKTILNSLYSVLDMCQDKDLKEIIESKLFQKKELLTNLEYDINQKRSTINQTETTHYL